MAEIVIDATLETTGFRQGSQELENAIRSMIKSAQTTGRDMTNAAKQYGSSIQAASGNVEKFDSAIDRSRDSISKLVERYRTLSQTRFDTDKYAELKAEIDKAHQALGNLLDRQEKMESLGVKKKSNQWKNLQLEIEKAKEELESLKNLRDEMQENGEAYVYAADSGMYDTLKQKLLDINDQWQDMKIYRSEALRGEFASDLAGSLGRITAIAGKTTVALAKMAGGAALSFLKKLASSAKNAAIQLAKLASSAAHALQSGLRRIGSLAVNATKALFGLGKSAKESGTGFNLSLKNILKYGLGIRSLFVLTNRLRGAITDSFGSLVKQFPAMNKSISGMVTSLNTLKNSFGAAFAPIVTAIAPYITSFLNMLSSAMTQVSKFIAVLTGQSYYYKAKTVQVDYAKSLDKTTKSQKGTTKATKDTTEAIEEEARQLASFDDLNILSDSRSNGSSGGGASGVAAAASDATDAFEKVPIDSTLGGLSDIMEKLKGIFDVFKQSWAENGQATINAAKAAFQSLVNAATTVANTIYDVFTSGVGLSWVNSWQTRIQSLFAVVKSLADTFVKAWDDNNTGYNYVKSIFDVLTQINLLIASFRNSFAEAWNSDVGISIWTRILNIATNVRETIALIAQRFREAWEDNGRGTQIWTDILNVVNSVATAIEGITASFVEWAAELDFGPVLNAFDGLLKAINPVVDALMNGLKFAFTDVLEPFGKWTIEKALPALLGLLADAFDSLSTTIDALKGPALELWNNFFVPLGSWVATSVIKNINDLRKSLQDASKAIEESGLEGLPDVLAGLAEDVGEKIANLFNTAISVLSTAVDKIPWHDIATILGRGLNGFLQDVDWDGLGKLIGKLFGKVTGAFADLVGEIKFGELGTKLANGLNSMFSEQTVHWSELGTKVGAAVQKIIEGIKNFADTLEPEELAKGLATFISSALEQIQPSEFASALSELVKRILYAGAEFLAELREDGQLKQKLEEFFSGIDWEGITKAMLTLAWEAFRTLGETLAGLVVDGFRDAFGLNGKSIEEAAEEVGNIGSSSNDMGLALVGGKMAEEIFIGIMGRLEDEKGELKSEYKDFFEETLGSIDNYGYGTGSAEKFFNGFLKKVLDEKGKVKPQYKSVIEEIWGSVEPFENGKITMEQFYAGWDKATTDGEASSEETTKAAFDKICGAVEEDTIEVGSPSKRAERMGKAYVDGFTKGVEGQKTNAETRTKSVFDSIAGVIESAKNGVKNFFSGIFGRNNTQKDTPTDVVTADSIAKPYEDGAARVSTATNNIKTYSSNMVTSVATSFSTLGTTINTDTSTAVEAAKTNFSTMGADIKTNVSTAVLAIVANFSTLKTGVVTHVTGAATSVITKFKEMANNANSESTAAKTSAQTNFTAMKTNLANNMNSIKETVSAGFNAVKSSVSTNVTGAKSTSQSNFTTMKTNIATNVDSIKKKVSDGFGAVKKNITDNLNTAKTNAGKISWESIGSAIVNGIQAGLNNGWAWLQNTVMSLAQSLYSAACWALGIASPSKVFRDGVGEMIGLGIAEGIEGSEGTVISTIDDLTGDMVRRMANLDAISTSVTFKTPEVALGGLTPYSISGKLDSDSSGLAAALAASNDDLESVIIQSVNNATVAVVRAIQQYSTTNVNLDARSLTDTIIEEINRRTRAAGSSPLLI